MKAVIISFVGALVVGISVAGAASVVRHPPIAAAAPAPAAVKHDSTGADSVRVIDSTDVKGAAAAAAPIADGGHAAPVQAAEAKHEIKQQGEPAPANAPLSPIPLAHGANAPASPAPAAGKAALVPTTTGIPEQRIARVFASMAPKDAAKVLEQMSDPDIVTILGNLSEKQNALILAKLPATRVAALSKVGLRPHATQP